MSRSARHLRRTIPQQACSGALPPLVGISFDVQGTLYGFKGNKGVGSAYLACARRFLKELECQRKGDAHASPLILPTAKVIEDRFILHSAYKSVMNARRQRYLAPAVSEPPAASPPSTSSTLNPILAFIEKHRRELLLLEESTSNHTTDTKTCATPFIDFKARRLSQIPPLSDETSIPFGGFTATEVKEDWLGVLAYVFGYNGEVDDAGNASSSPTATSSKTGVGSATSATTSATPPRASPLNIHPTTPSELSALCHYVFDAFATPFPYQLLPTTRNTLLTLRVKYPSVPIAAVTNNDDRVVRILDEMLLFGQDETSDANGNTSTAPSKRIGDHSLDESTTADWALARQLFGPSTNLCDLTVGDLLDVIVTPNATGAAKPHPSTIREAIRRCDRMTSSTAPSEPLADPLSDTSFPASLKGWVHVGDHKVDKMAALAVDKEMKAASLGACDYVPCDPIKGPDVGLIEATLLRHL